MRYLVTGGAGFLGSALVRRLLADNHQVTVLDDFSRGHRNRLQGLHCTIYDGDIRDYIKIADASHGCDAILHLAYLQGTQTFYAEPRQVLDIALRGMMNVLRACESNGIRELLLVSSSEAYQTAAIVPTPETIPLTVPDPLNPRYSYGGGKIACEILANAWYRTGVLDQLIIVRPHNIYGPDMGRDHVIPEFCLRMNELLRLYSGSDFPDPIPFPVQGTGEETRSFCYIDDFVDQLELLLSSAPDGPNIYNVGTQDERTINDVAHDVAECYGCSIKVIPGILAKGSPPRRLPDTSKIEALGWDATQRTLFSVGLARTVMWYQEHV